MIKYFFDMIVAGSDRGKLYFVLVQVISG